MRKFIVFSSLVIIVLPIFFLLMNREISLNNLPKEFYEKESQKEFENESENESSEEKILKRVYHSKLESLYSVHDHTEINKIWRAINKMPGEKTSVSPETQWNTIGPYTITYDQNVQVTGRVRDVETLPNSVVRVGTATGGLWEISFLTARPLSDNLNCLSIGAFASVPSNPDIIYAGTGEWAGGSALGVEYGTGLWKTVNKGSNWAAVNLGMNVNAFNAIRINPLDENYIYAATTNGLFVTTNGGTNWTLNYTGNVTDVILDPVAANYVFIGEFNSGYRYSTNYGASGSFVNTNVAGFPANSGNIKLAISRSSNNILYASVSHRELCSNNIGLSGLGIYKSTDRGLTWEYKVTPDNFWCQGAYNNAIAINPINPNYVIQGAGDLLFTTNGGVNWTETGGGHHDHHVLKWNADASLLYDGNDGGIFISPANGSEWSSLLNFLPITQFYAGDIGVTNTNIIAGGAQDNAVPFSSNGGASWFYKLGGDGTDAVINPSNFNNIIAANNGGIHNTFNLFQNTSYAHNGLNPPPPFFNFLQSNKYSNGYIYLACGPNIYRTTNGGNLWVDLNSPDESFGRIGAEKGNSSGNEVLYVPVGNAVKRLTVFINGTFYTRNAGIPVNRFVTKVSTHPRDTAVAFACLNVSSSPVKLLKTTNRGILWTDISGITSGLPVSPTDVMAHPTDPNIIIAGTWGFGFFKTSDGGQSWFKWNDGAPVAANTTDLTFIDSASINKFYVVAFTSGRSVMRREIGLQDSVSVNINDLTSGVKNFNLYQNYPNPFNPATNISFYLKNSSQVKISVFDVNGRKTADIMNEKKAAGNHRITFNGSALTSGVYFYRMETESFTDTKKMILVK